MDRIAAMKAFIRVVETGSFTRAATTLDWPKATVTRLIQFLEAYLGVRLLQRTTRAIALTIEGTAYYERLLPLLADLEDMESAARGPGGPPSGRVSVAMPPSLASVLLVPALPDFHERFPSVELELHVSNRLTDLIADHIDCAIRVGRTDDPAIRVEPLGEYQVVTCASPAYLDRHGVPRHPSDLESGHRTVGLVSSHGTPFPFQFSRNPLEIAVDFQLPHVLLTNDSNAYLAAAHSGLGVIQMPAHFIRRAVSCGHLVPILGDWSLTPARQVNLLYASGRPPGAALRAFMDWLQELFRIPD